MKKNKLTRRDFIAISTGSALMLKSAFYSSNAFAQQGNSQNSSRVVKVYHPNMVGRLFPDAQITQNMVEAGIKSLTGRNNVAQAWGQIVTPQDRVGIKINCLAGRFSSTSKEVVDAIIAGLRAAGVPDANIMVFDQFGGNMQGARYVLQSQEGRLRVIPHSQLGYQTQWTTYTGGRAKISNAFLWTTAIINVPVYKDHDLCGVTGTIKNISCGIVERPSMLHRNINEQIVNFYALQQVQSKIKLHIADASWVLYNNGPRHNTQFRTQYNSIFLSTDPVAMDAIELEVLEQLRQQNGLRPFAQVRRPATYITLAEQAGLGVGTRNRIQLNTVNLPTT